MQLIRTQNYLNAYLKNMLSERERFFNVTVVPHTCPAVTNMFKLGMNKYMEDYIVSYDYKIAYGTKK